MKRLGFLVVATLAGAACSRAQQDPTGQVVATVGGQEITSADLRAEMASDSIGPQGDTASRHQALERLISRKILAAAALQQKLDQSPSGSIMLRKARDETLAEILEGQLGEKVPAASLEEAREFVLDHPAMFSGRRILVLEQTVASNVPQPVLSAMAPVNTMDAAIALLDRNKVPHHTTMAAVDTLEVAPDAAPQLVNLSDNSVFLSREGNVTKISQVRGSIEAPLSGDAAVTVARDVLSSQRRSTIVEREVSDFIAQQRREVKVNPAYAPDANPPNDAQHGKH